MKRNNDTIASLDVDLDSYGKKPRLDPTSILNLPNEILRQILEYLLPTQRVEVTYCDAQPQLQPFRALTKSGCRMIVDQVIEIIYSQNTFFFEVDSYNTFPLFLVRLRPSTLSKIRSVLVRNGYLGNLSLGLDLLLHCEDLSSLEITGKIVPPPYMPILRCFRLKNFAIEGRSERHKSLCIQVLSNQCINAKQQARISESSDVKVGCLSKFDRVVAHIQAACAIRSNHDVPKAIKTWVLNIRGPTCQGAQNSMLKSLHNILEEGR